MSSTPHDSRRWILIVALAIWVGGLFLVSRSTWLRPFVSGEVQAVSGELWVAAAGERHGRARLGHVTLPEGEARVLEIEAPVGQGFTVQIQDNITRQSLRLLRVPARSRARLVRFPLDSRTLPPDLRLRIGRKRTDVI